MHNSYEFMVVKDWRLFPNQFFYCLAKDYCQCKGIFSSIIYPCDLWLWAYSFLILSACTSGTIHILWGKLISRRLIQDRFLSLVPSAHWIQPESLYSIICKWAYLYNQMNFFPIFHHLICLLIDNLNEYVLPSPSFIRIIPIFWLSVPRNAMG
jgi:hypothetical protein